MAVTFYFARHGETYFNVMGKVQGWCDSPLTSEGVYDAYKLGQSLAAVDLVGACASDSGRAQETLSIALEAWENERKRIKNTPATSEGIKPANAEQRELESGVDARDVEAIEQYLRSRGYLASQNEPAASPKTDDGGHWAYFSGGWEPRVDDLKGLEYPAYDLDDIPRPPRFVMPVHCDRRLREWCYGELEGDSVVRFRDCIFEALGQNVPREVQNERLDEIADYLCACDSLRKAENFSTIARRIRSFLSDCGNHVQRLGGGNVLVITHAMIIRTIVFLYARDRVNNPPVIKNASLTKVTWDDGVVTVGEIGVSPSS